MKTTNENNCSSRAGSAMVTTLVMLSVSGLIIGSVAAVNRSNRRVAGAYHSRDKAFYLAESGLQVALARINEYNAPSEGAISYDRSRDFFSQIGNMRANDWGFQSRMDLTTGQQHVVTSTGRYQSQTVTVSAELTLGPGSRSFHALYAHPLFAGNASGNTNYSLRIGGVGRDADFVDGDVYSGGDIHRTGDAVLRLPEAFISDYDNDGVCDPMVDTWQNAYAPQVFTNPLTQAQFNAYTNAQAPNRDRVYNDGRFNPGEAFVDTIGNGVYDVGEPFVDGNGNGVRDLGDSYIDRNGNGRFDAGTDTVVDRGNGRWDPGEEWTEDIAPNRHNRRVNGRYDPAGGFWRFSGGQWNWITARYRVSGVWHYPSTWPAEAFEDVGDGAFNPAETFTDQNGVFDVGEQYFDDRNAFYDYGVQAANRITGMPAPGPGQRAATGFDAPIDPPDLARMFYHLDRNAPKPADALPRWGHDVAVTAADYGGHLAITETNRPEHIFIRNPPTGSNIVSRGRNIMGRSYTRLHDRSGNRIDDYFLEDPTDPTFNTIPSGEAHSIARNDNNRTHTTYIDVRPSANLKLYYVEGNVYIHSPSAFAFRFRRPGTRIAIVARGNITISDEFYYNATYDPNLQYTNMNSSVVRNPSDALVLIALNNPNSTNSGNIFIGDAQFGTGGSIHAMLYAENDFVDNNVNTVDQQFISIFGNMSAGNHVRINRPTGTGQHRTRLDVTLDERIRDGTVIVPGLPHPVGDQRNVQLDTAWRVVPGTWRSWSMLQ